MATYAEAMDKLLVSLTTSTGSYYEYYDRNGDATYESKLGSPSTSTQRTKAVHLHLDIPGSRDSDYMIMFYTVGLHGAGTSKMWKILSEGPNSTNPAKALEYDKKAKEIADKEGWKYIALGIANPDPGDPFETQMNDYVVAIESYKCGEKAAHPLGNALKDLVAKGSPEFFRFICNDLPMAFVKKDILENYLKFFDNRPFQKYTSSAVRYIHTSGDSSTQVSVNQYPFNWLISGAPGTGKSFFLNDESEKLVFGGRTIKDLVEESVKNDSSTETDEVKTKTYSRDFEEEKKKKVVRVTFYEDYMYDSFVGGYKPIVVDDDIAEIEFDKKTGVKKESKVTYTYVPGPFMDTYIKAKNDPDHKYCLIIEELNRAKAASVFGDMFQLLDRKNGESVYSVSSSAELQQYLDERLISAQSNEVRLPNNFYIWATMNSADRGVFPIDSAFKRRWTYKCQNVYAPRTDGGKISFFYDEKIVTVLFDNFRNLLNEKIGDDEDKYIGPWYFSSDELEEIKKHHENISNGIECDCSGNPLVSKLLLYLRQDIFRHNPDELFYEGNTVSRILNSYGIDYGIEKILKLTPEEITSLMSSSSQDDASSESDEHDKAGKAKSEKVSSTGESSKEEDNDVIEENEGIDAVEDISTGE